MKKEIKSYEELTKCHLRPYTAIYGEKFISGIIKVSENGEFVQLQYDMQNYYYESFLGDSKKYWIKEFEKPNHIKKIKNIIVDLEDWKPKFGEVVYVSDSEEMIKTTNNTAVFLFKHNNVFHCSSKIHNDVFFNQTREPYKVIAWKYIRKLEEPKLELNFEEARQIIADAKGVKAENINLKIK